MGIGNIGALSISDGAFRKEMPSPTEDQLADPRFEAIWQVIKGWDIGDNEYYVGYMGANGSHAVRILNALDQLDEQRVKKGTNDTGTEAGQKEAG